MSWRWFLSWSNALRTNVINSKFKSHKNNKANQASKKEFSKKWKTEILSLKLSWLEEN